MSSANEIIQKALEEWGERDVYHLEETDLADLILTSADVSEVDNHDGTITVTVTVGSKQFICTKRAIP